MTEQTDAQVLTAEQVQITAFLQSLKAAARHVCTIAVDERSEHETLASSAIEWPALDCARAEAYIDHDATRGYRVYLTGALAAGGGFRQFVHDKLRDEGFESIEVVTRW